MRFDLAAMVLIGCTHCVETGLHLQSCLVGPVFIAIGFLLIAVAGPVRQLARWPNPGGLAAADKLDCTLGGAASVRTDGARSLLARARCQGAATP